MKYLSITGLLLLVVFIYTPLVLFLAVVFWWVVSGSILFQINAIQFFTGFLWTLLWTVLIVAVCSPLKL